MPNGVGVTRSSDLGIGRGGTQAFVNSAGDYAKISPAKSGYGIAVGMKDCVTDVTLPQIP
jgi:hypothetical protein